MSAVNSITVRPAPIASFEIDTREKHGPLASRVSDAPSASKEKVNKVWKLRAIKVGIVFAAILFFIITLGGSLWARVYSHFYNKSLSDDIEKAHIKSVSESLQIVLAGPDRGQRTAAPVEVSPEGLKDGLLLAYRIEKGFVPGSDTKAEAEKLTKEVLKIRSKVERLSSGEAVRGGIEGLRDDLSKVMKGSFYQAVETQDCEAVNFLQFVAIKLIGADGSEALTNYGKKCLGDLKGGSFTPTNLADLMSDVMKQPGFSYGGLKWLVYAACHPMIAMHSAESVLNPLGYNASHGNPNFSAHAFTDGDKKMTFYYGPGPTGNPIFEHGILSAYEKFGVFELRFNHQDTSNKSEYYRVKEIQRMGDENPVVMRHALLGFDTKMKNNKAVAFDDPDTFFTTYRAYVKNGIRGQANQKEHSGFYVPTYLLSDKQVDTAIDKAQEFCTTLSRNNRYWIQTMRKMGPSTTMNKIRYAWHSAWGNEKALYPLKHRGKARMAKMMQLISDTYLTLAMIYRSFDAITPEMVQRSLDEKLDKDLTALRTSGACKQNVDRAVVQNISLRLFFRWSQNPAPLTDREVYEITGAVFGRARLVDDRKIMSRRFLILEDLLRFIGSAQGGVDTAHSLLKTYRQALNESSPWRPWR